MTQALPLSGDAGALPTSRIGPMEPRVAGNGRPRIATATRHIVHRTNGRRHGPLTRVFSPSDVGGLTKPFVFLDYFDFIPDGRPMFAMHPHSGIATTTILLSGNMHYEDTTGAAGNLEAGSVEWLNAGGGVWHDAVPQGQARFRGYQLWVALPQAWENASPSSQYLPAEAIPTDGPARVILGRHGTADSLVKAPDGLHLLHVRLAAGERWSYAPPGGHTIAWAHVSAGALWVGATRVENELAVFDESDDAIDFIADGPTEFIVASARKHPHDLVLGYYSVHSNPAALHRGETEIARIGEQLRASGRIR